MKKASICTYLEFRSTNYMLNGDKTMIMKEEEIVFASRTRRGLLSVIWAICHFQEALGWLQEALGASNPWKVMSS